MLNKNRLFQDRPGLPDGIFSYQKSQFRNILEGLGMEMLVYFIVTWYILSSFGIFCHHLVYFVIIWYILSSFGYFIIIWLFYHHLVYFMPLGVF
jgi:hypothetical protein